MRVLAMTTLVYALVTGLSVKREQKITLGEMRSSGSPRLQSLLPKIISSPQNSGDRLESF